jgi:hypothetical protein
VEEEGLVGVVVDQGEAEEVSRGEEEEEGKQRKERREEEEGREEEEEEARKREEGRTDRIRVRSLSRIPNIPGGRRGRIRIDTGRS